ncbi:MAG: hypothetical protein VKI82_13655, partial [Leptolyngbya sp.]|nr:hypothetical protein [Leptolyngbya sp.]
MALVTLLNRNVARVGFMALLYAVQAATGNPGLAFLPVAHYLTQHQGFAAAQLAGFQALVLLPWMIKPLWAIAIDGLIQRGYTTQGCLILSFGSIALGFGLLSQVQTPTVGLLLLGLGLISAVIAFSDVVADRWMVIEGQRHQRGNLYQAAQWVGWGSTAMAMFLVGGWLADRIPLNQVFGLSTLVPILALGLVIWKWPDVEKTPSQHKVWPNRSQGSDLDIQQRPGGSLKNPGILARKFWQSRSQGSDLDTQQRPGDSLKNPGIFSALINALKQPDLRQVLGLVVLLQLSPLPIDYLYQ